MIPYDQYTIAVIALLVIFGVVGLLRPTLFLRSSRIPLMQRQRAKGTERELAAARRWALVCLFGAALLYFLARG